MPKRPQPATFTGGCTFSWVNKLKPEDFKRFFGVHRKTVQYISDALKLSNDKVILCLDHLKSSDCQFKRCMQFSISEKTYRDHVRTALDSFDKYQRKSGLYLSKFQLFRDISGEDFKEDLSSEFEDGKIALAVDTTIIPVETNDNSYFNVEKHVHGVKFEIAVSLGTGEILYVSGPHKAAEQDLSIYRKYLKDIITDIQESNNLSIKAIGDQAYYGEQETMLSIIKHKKGEPKILKEKKNLFNSWIKSKKFIVANQFQLYKEFKVFAFPWRKTKDLDKLTSIFYFITWCLNIEKKFKKDDTPPAIDNKNAARKRIATSIERAEPEKKRKTE